MMDYLQARMRRVLCLATVGLVVGFVAGAAIFSVRESLAQQPVTVQIGSGSGAVGDDVTVRLSLLDLEPPGLGAFNIDVHYDPGMLDPVSPCTTNPDSVSGLVVICNMGYDTITVEVAGFQPNPDAVVGDVALADLTFTVLSNGASALTPEVRELADTSAQPIDYVVEGGTITGLPEAETPTATATATPTRTSTPTPTATSTPAPTAHGVGGAVLLPPAAIADASGGASGGSGPGGVAFVALVGGIVAALGLGGYARMRRRGRG